MFLRAPLTIKGMWSTLLMIFLHPLPKSDHHYRTSSRGMNDKNTSYFDKFPPCFVFTLQEIRAIARTETIDQTFSEDIPLSSLKRSRKNYPHNILTPKFCYQSCNNPIARTNILVIGFGGLISHQNFGEFWRKFGHSIARTFVLAIGLVIQLVSHGETLGVYLNGVFYI